jgi:hypothetical protein
MQQAQQAINGTADNLDGVSTAAKNLGINAKTVNEMYSRYGNTVQARTVCRLLGTTPEALKEDADRIVSGVGSAKNATTTRFPRLK